jgi:hypothetical protein
MVNACKVNWVQASFENLSSSFHQKHAFFLARTLKINYIKLVKGELISFQAPTLYSSLNFA